ncbi:uncharacterized protein [Nicotiana sylvestris]|uniref:uncharacterized protein n=1 Tax=Nicotiana sylvestris TaxID=4096 RepID=UPI00388CC7BD
MGCIETRVKEHQAKKIQKKIAQGWNACCNSSFVVNERIWILWKAHIQVQIILITDQFIHCLIEDTSTQFKTHLSVIYAQNDGHQRENLWRDLRQINIPAHEIWLLSGDFNNVLSSEDRIGSPVIAVEIQGFKDVIDTLQLTPFRAKDLVQTKDYDRRTEGYKCLYDFIQTETGAGKKKLDIIQSQIQQYPLAHGLFYEEKDTLAEIEKWSNVEEHVMRQKSNACWIECGDTNTKYFHAQWKIRSSQNSITSIYTNIGIKLTKPKLVEPEFISVFQSFMGDCTTEFPCAKHSYN